MAGLLQTLHFFGFGLVLFALGAVILHVIQGGDRNFYWRRPLHLFHGLGLLFLLGSGLGLVAERDWNWNSILTLKILYWVFLGAALPLAYRNTRVARLLWWLVPVSVLPLLWLIVSGLTAKGPVSQ